MGKAIATPKSNKKGPIIVKFWYNDVEPPKNYVWVRDDFYYIYQNHNWVPYEYEDLLPQLPVGCICEKVPTNSCNMQCSCIKYVTSADLTDRLEKFQKELLAKIVKLINTSTSGDVGALDKYIKEQLEPRIEQLENNESNYLTSNALNGYATEQWVENNATIPAANVSCNISGDIFDFSNVNNGLSVLVNKVEDINNDISLLDNRISSIEGSVGGSYDDSELRGRIESLEEMSGNYATTEMIPTKVSELTNDAGYISGVEISNPEDTEDYVTLSNGDNINVITDIEFDRNSDGIYKLYGHLTNVTLNVPESEVYDDTAIRKTIEDKELVISSSLNNLNDRIIAIESADYATQNWVENSALIPASNVTCNISSDAFDFSDANTGLTALVNNVEDLKNDATSMDSRITDLETNSINTNELNTVKNEINKTIEDNELVISSAFNDLNDRMIVLENNA